MLWKLISGACGVVRLPGRNSALAEIRTMSRNWAGDEVKGKAGEVKVVFWPEPLKEFAFYRLFSMYLMLSPVHRSEENSPCRSGVCVLGELRSLRIN